MFRVSIFAMLLAPLAVSAGERSLSITRTVNTPKAGCFGNAPQAYVAPKVGCSGVAFALKPVQKTTWVWAPVTGTIGGTQAKKMPQGPPSVVVYAPLPRGFFFQTREPLLAPARKAASVSAAVAVAVLEGVLERVRAVLDRVRPREKHFELHLMRSRN